MTTVSLILLDLNGVLYKYDRNARISYLASVSKVSPAQVMAAIWDSGFEDAGDAGALDATAYLQGFGASIGYALTEAAWVAAQRVALSPITPTLGLLPRLRPDVRCAVLTNNNLLLQQHFSMLYPEVATLVGDRAYVSAEFGVRKPNPDVYRRCLHKLGVPPEAALFVDDSPANAAGARDAGLHAFIYTDPTTLEAEFHKLGVID